MTYRTGFKVGHFSLSVPQGEHLDSGHIRLSHGDQYSILLTNAYDLPCDADVSIDGKSVGCWRIDPSRRIELERPANDPGRFTFSRLGSQEARDAALQSDDQLGLITVTFMPSIRYSDDLSVRYSPARGGTGLSGRSEQRFDTVAALSYDEYAIVTINARLFCGEQKARPLKDMAWSSIPSPLPR